MPTQQQRSDATREALLAACRALLLAEGTEATTMAAVLTRTGLSKGALYHHFASKTELIAAIYKAESKGAIARALARAEQAGAVSPLAQLTTMCAAWLEEIRAPDVAAILLRIGPAALGVEEAQRIENANSLTLFERQLARAAEAGEIGSIDQPLAARLVNALMTQLAVASLRGSGQPLPDVEKLILGVLRGMEGEA
ncbi:TetR/AcrR family transcriptional regulator [Erythrobacter sp. BLCC-B19]|uniref:TetR/AcrR family transcriptional regulator n=1 Tax=Erythrobacter sp. BLCC-B19 TaxID=3025315 RepID=UPI00235E2ED9|nr:TetR/AcrR family transcriptional regulator [Erythrobacter sp. BLCC-B19]WDA40214.1 TetR/AcrR family transcriptional regulator [Erythrobacter sp. BLCC-B19]